MNVRKSIPLMASALLTALAPTAIAADLSLTDARQVMKAAIGYARAHEAPGGAIAIVDAGAHVVLLERLDGTFPAAAEISTGKARTAALFRRATRDFERIVNEGRTTMVALPQVTPFTPLRGGVPIVVDGEIVGAVGVSGAASAEQDDEIAQAAADAGAASIGAHSSSAVTHLDGQRVAEAFIRGAPLVEQPGYKVHASRRDGPGEAEVHLDETDIFYVLEGNAIFVTGGELVEPRRTAPGEMRGSEIRGGKRTTLARGDVMVIPRGVPHWFERVDGKFTYYVVKSAS